MRHKRLIVFLLAIASFLHPILVSVADMAESQFIVGRFVIQDGVVYFVDGSSAKVVSLCPDVDTITVHSEIDGLPVDVDHGYFTSTTPSQENEIFKR